MKPFKFTAGAQRERYAGRAGERHDVDHLVDAMLDVYMGWREECLTVSSAYEDWTCAAHGDKARASAAYLAALDREQLAAASYRRLAERVSQTVRQDIG